MESTGNYFDLRARVNKNRPPWPNWDAAFNAELVRCDDAGFLLSLQLGEAARPAFSAPGPVLLTEDWAGRPAFHRAHRFRAEGA